MTQASTVQPSTLTFSDLQRPGALTPAQLERALARGRHLQGMAVRSAFSRLFNRLFSHLFPAASPRDRTLGRKTQAC